MTCRNSLFILFYANANIKDVYGYNVANALSVHTMYPRGKLFDLHHGDHRYENLGIVFPAVSHKLSNSSQLKLIKCKKVSRQ